MGLYACVHVCVYFLVVDACKCMRQAYRVDDLRPSVGCTYLGDVGHIRAQNVILIRTPGTHVIDFRLLHSSVLHGHVQLCQQIGVFQTEHGFQQGLVPRTNAAFGAPP